ncbi:hypothetical protein CEXT_316811 [Caerostris extrusa]|uniref:Uncharacterized protein n=1 Tax=Caerostris extrusa TaxID=172846 RepID=A0AAV4WU86_CAEEX|nr:hypothetical protein CEXT_316811 [Caerostris extrusa]
MVQHPNASSQLECSLISSTNESLPHFSSAYHNFSEIDPTLTNEASQYSETASEIPILNIQNAQYCTDNPIDSNEQIETFPFTMSTSDYNLDKLSPSINNLCGDRRKII